MRRLPFALVVVAAIGFLALGGERAISLSVLAANAVELRDLAAHWPRLAPILYVTANAALLMLLVVPAWFCTLISGLMFGPWLGAAYALAGTTLGAAAVFAAARGGLVGLADRTGALGGRMAANFRQNALSYVIFLRLVPLAPFTAINIGAALADVPLRAFLVGTLVGIVPSVAIYADLGDTLLALIAEGRPPGPNFLMQPRVFLPLSGLALLALLPVLVRRRQASASRRSTQTGR